MSIELKDLLKPGEQPTSGPNDFDRVDVKNWAHNFLIFLAPLAVMYLGSVIGFIQTEGFSLKVFIPNSFLQGGMILYILNTALDFFRKYIN